MTIRDAASPAQFPQNPVRLGPVGGSVGFVHDSGSAENLLAELRGRGVVLSIEDSRLAFDAPAGVLSDELLARMRVDRDGLLAMLLADSADTETAGDAGPGDSAGASSMACPWCGPVALIDDPEGLRCSRCERLAWFVTVAGRIERADLIDTEAIDPQDIPTCPRCDRLADTITAVEGWACTRCEPHRAKITARVLAIRERWRRE